MVHLSNNKDVIKAFSAIIMSLLEGLWAMRPQTGIV